MLYFIIVVLHMIVHISNKVYLLKALFKIHKKSLLHFPIAKLSMVNFNIAHPQIKGGK